MTVTDYVSDRAIALGPRGPVAMVTSHPVVISVGHLYAFDGGERGFHIEVFADPADAERWLDEELAADGERRPAVGALVEPRWRVVGPDQRVVTCAIYRLDDDQFEIRVGRVESDLLRARRTRDLGSARDLADQWRQALLSRGGFIDVPPPGDSR